MIREEIRSVVADYRAWVLTVGLLGLYAVGFLVPIVVSRTRSAYRRSR